MEAKSKMVLPIFARLAGGAAARFGGPVVKKAVTSLLGRTAVPRIAKAAVKTVTARVPALTPVTKMLRKAVGISPITRPPARTLPIVARPVARVSTAIQAKAAEFIAKPFRTTLPYAATAGMMGAVSRYGEEKAVTGVERGALVGTALTMPSAIPAMLPSGLERVGVGRMGIGEALVPGAAPVIVRSWTTGTTDFAVDSTGKHWVLTKSGWKKYSPKKPIVLGTKHLTPKKFIQAAKKYYALKKDLDKVFKVVRKKK